MQSLDHDHVTRHIEAPAGSLYDVIADVTRMPELSPELDSCTWIGVASGPEVGARFVAVNVAPNGRTWKNRPVVTVADRPHEFAITRTEPMAGTVHWRYLFEPDGTGTTVTESYDVERPVARLGWFVIERVFAGKDRRAALRAGMEHTLARLAHLVETQTQTPASTDTQP